MTSEGGNPGKAGHFHLILNRQLLVNPVQCQLFDFSKKKISSDFGVKLSVLDVSNLSKIVWEVHKHDCMLQIAPEMPVSFFLLFIFVVCVCGVFVFAFFFFFNFKKPFQNICDREASLK